METGQYPKDIGHFFFRYQMIEKIQELRKLTSLSLAECKKAITEANGDIDQALKILKVFQNKRSEKVDGNLATEGRIECYMHPGNRVASMVEVRCQTDFAARAKEFVSFCETIAMQVTAMQPSYISDSDVPEEVITDVGADVHHRAGGLIFSCLGDKDAWIAARMKDWRSAHVLMHQSCITQQKYTIEELLTELKAKLGENVVISKMQRWEIK